MECEPRPSWLIRQENGAIAEARTRALLADRFWILERSVDIEGADYIVQRRLTARSLLERDAPRLGFVQAKFYQDGSTTQYVHREYVVDKDGKPRPEFFLLCHTGIEESARAFFVSARDIDEGFRLTSQSHSRPNRYEISGRLVLTPAYEVLHRGRVLQHIEQALINADFVANRGFMSWALPSIGAIPAIREEFCEKIDNWYGDIPPEFERLRTRAKEVLWSLSEAADLIHEIASTADPLVAIDRLEDLEYQFGRAVSIDDIYDSHGFASIVRFHHERYEHLKSSGLLGSHAALRHIIKSRLVAGLEARKPAHSKSTYCVELRYDPDSLALLAWLSWFDSIVVPGNTIGDQRYFRAWEVFEVKPGYVCAGMKTTQGPTAANPAESAASIEQIAEGLTGEVMTRILEVRFDSSDEEKK